MLKGNSCGNNLDNIDVDRTLECPMMSYEPLDKLHLKNLVPRIQNSCFLLTSDHITTPKLYTSPIFFPNSTHFHSLHVTRIFSIKRPNIYVDPI